MRIEHNQKTTTKKQQKTIIIIIFFFLNYVNDWNIEIDNINRRSRFRVFWVETNLVCQVTGKDFFKSY